MVNVYFTVNVTRSDEIVLKQPCAKSTLRCCAVGARVELEELAMKALVYKIADGHTVDDLTEEVCCGAWVTSLNLRGTSPAMHLPSIHAKQTGCLQYTNIHARQAHVVHNICSESGAQVVFRSVQEND